MQSASRRARQPQRSFAAGAPIVHLGTAMLRRLVALAAIAAVAWLALHLLLLLFAGILFGIFLRSVAVALANRTNIRTGLALAIVIFAIAGILAAVSWLYAPRLAQQADELTRSIPQAFDDLTTWVRQYEWGRGILEEAQSPGDGQVMQRATTAFRRVSSAMVAIAVVLFTGIYLAAQPEPYIRGVLRLVPLRHRRRAAEVLYASGQALRAWLVGQFVAMIVVGVAMGAGLALIGVPLSLLLGVLAGVFEFVPLVGPLIALGPALLLALANSPQQAAYVLVLYAFVQTAESYVVTPLVQRRAVELPPVVTIGAQLGLSWMAGAIGLLVAVPLTAVGMVATQMLYVRDTLGDSMQSDWAREAHDVVEQERERTLAGVLPESPDPPVTM